MRHFVHVGIAPSQLDDKTDAIDYFKGDVMDTKLQTITMTIYPYATEKCDWTLEAYVCGDYAVHKPRPSDEAVNELADWVISYIPTGSMALASLFLEDAIVVAKRLDALEKPDVKVEYRDGIYQHVPPASDAWLTKVMKAAKGLEVFGISNSGFRCTPEECLRIIRRRAKSRSKEPQP